MNFTRRAFALTAIGSASLFSLSAAAQNYPTKTLKIIIPFAAGGPVDAVGRDLAVKLGQQLGQSVIIENVGGGAGLPAMQALGRAAADGHTMILAGASHVTIQTLLSPAGADAAKKLAPVSLVSTSPHVLFVNSKLPVTTLKEYIAYAKANPGTLNYASAGSGSVSHLGMEVINAQAGIKATHIAYRGTSQATVDLAGNQVQAMLSSMASLKGLVEKGVVRPIGLTSETLASDSKHLPLISSAVPGASYTTWYAMYVPVGTPIAAVEKLQNALGTVLAESAFKDKFREMGTDLKSSTSAELLTLTAGEIKMWAKAIKTAGVAVD